MTAGIGPEDLERVDLGELATSYRLHLADTQSTHGTRRSALSALTVGEAIVRNVARDRWWTVISAMEQWATLAQLATALGLESREVAAGLHSWADRLVLQNAMTHSQREEIDRLLAVASRSEEDQ